MLNKENVCGKLIKRAKKEHEKNIAKECKNDPKLFWKYVQSKLKFSTGISPLKRENGEIAETDADKAETINTFSSKVFTRENLSNTR